MTLDTIHQAAIERIYAAHIIVNLRREALGELVERTFPLAPETSKAAILAGLQALWDRDRRGGRAPASHPVNERIDHPDVDRHR